MVLLGLFMAVETSRFERLPQINSFFFYVVATVLLGFFFMNRFPSDLTFSKFLFFEPSKSCIVINLFDFRFDNILALLFEL